MGSDHGEKMVMKQLWVMLRERVRCVWLGDLGRGRVNGGCSIIDV
jgi:hypothetical protein